MKGTNAKENIFMVVLLVIIIIAGAILALKITGIIKPSERKVVVEEEKEYKNDMDDFDFYDEDELERRANNRKTLSTVLNIISIVIALIISIGTSKLYRKLGLPNYIVVFTLIYPLLSITGNWTSGVLNIIINLAFGILGILSMYYYFKALEMSGKWAILPFAAMIILPFGISGLMMAGLIGGMPIIPSFITVISLTMIIAWLVAYIKSNIKIGQMFNKTTPFIVGLCILPFVFQPILGYSDKEHI